MMVDVGEEKGTIDKEESEMINNVFEFDDKVVSEIMIPRNDIYALDEDMTISGVLEKITTDKDFRYSRIPVYKENIDEIRGIIYIKDILMDVVTDKDMTFEKITVSIGEYPKDCVDRFYNIVKKIL